MSQVIDAEYHGLDPVLVLALLSVDPVNSKQVQGDAAQIALWLNASYGFPNLLGGASALILAYQNAPVSINPTYDATRVGVYDQHSNLIAQLINLAIPE